MSKKWADGIQPQGFRWVIADRLAVCERPGGYGIGHRKVRRQEEIIWLNLSRINMIITLTSAPYNLADYSKHDLDYIHLPFVGPTEGPDRLQTVFTTIQDQVAERCVLLHRESIGDRLTGVVAGYLLWAGLVVGGPDAVAVTERLLERELGPMARQIVSMALRLRSRSRTGL